MRRGTIWGALALATALGCSSNKGNLPPGGDGGTPATTRDLSYIRQSRALGTTEPDGLRNLEVFVSGAKMPVTRATAFDDSVCQVGCVITPDRTRLLYLEGQGEPELVSVPLGQNLEPDFGSPVQINDPGKPLAQPVLRLMGGSRVLFLQKESEGGPTPDGGVAPPTFSLISAAVAGGDFRTYRNGTFLPSSPFAASADGSRVVFGETLGAASQLNLYVYDANNPDPTTQPVFRFMQEGSAEFGGEVMAVSPNGAEVLIATQVRGDKVLVKVTTDGRTVTPPQRRIGPVECQAAAEGEICLVQSPLYYSLDGSKVFFLGGRQEGIAIKSQLYSVNADLGSAPVALSSFTTEIQSLAINRARNRVAWATEAARLKRNNAIFALDFSGGPLTGTPEKIIDGDSISFHFQEPGFLE
jgi:hypothetical protein